MTRQALAQGATFILWPESSTPFYFEEDSSAAESIRRLARETGATLLDRQRSDRACYGRTPRRKRPITACTTPRSW